MTTEHDLNAWGKRPPVTWPEHVTVKLSSDADRLLLQGAGLPANADFMLEFESSIEPAELVAEDGRGTRSRWLKIGTDGGGAVCVRLENGGDVWLIATEAGVRTRFMNSSVAALACCMAAMHVALQVVPEDEEGVSAWIQRVSKQLTDCDPAVLHDPEGWWSVILEQIEAGLM